MKSARWRRTVRATNIPPSLSILLPAFRRILFFRARLSRRVAVARCYLNERSLLHHTSQGAGSYAKISVFLKEKTHLCSSRKRPIKHLEAANAQCLVLGVKPTLSTESRDVRV